MQRESISMSITSCVFDEAGAYSSLGTGSSSSYASSLI